MVNHTSVTTSPPSHNDPGRTRTCNPRLRGPMPYPLGHGAVNKRQRDCKQTQTQHKTTTATPPPNGTNPRGDRDVQQTNALETGAAQSDRNPLPLQLSWQSTRSVSGRSWVRIPQEARLPPPRKQETHNNHGTKPTQPAPMTVWPSGLRRWLQAPVRKGVGSNPTAVNV